MGRTHKSDSNYKRPKDIKQADRVKSRQIDQHFSRTAYNSLEDKEYLEEYDDYSEDLNFEKFSKPHGKR